MTQHRRLLLLPLLLLAGAALVAALLLIPGAVGAQDATAPTNLTARIVDGGGGWR